MSEQRCDVCGSLMANGVCTDSMCVPPGTPLVIAADEVDALRAEVARLTAELERRTRERDEARAAEVVMREALHEQCVHGEYTTHGGSTVLVGMTCDICGPLPTDSTHKPTCILAQPSPGKGLIEELERLRTVCSAIYSDISDRLLDTDSPGTRQTLEGQRRMLERVLKGKVSQ